MRRNVPLRGRSVFTCVRVAIAFSLAGAVCSESAAQTPPTTLVLAAPDADVVDTTIRNGSHANTNQNGPVLLTRSNTARAILAFDTTRIPASSTITSAVLTLTISSGLGTAGSTRSVTLYRLAASFVEQEATWMSRQAGVPWQTAGGDLGESHGSVAVTNVPGARVAFDITALVQATVSGGFDSRQTRVALLDVGGGGPAKVSDRTYHASEAAVADNRPQLTIVYCGPTEPSNATIDVPSGGNLQQALNQIPSGGTVRLASGAVFVGNFVLPVKTGASFVTITTNTPLPPAGTRIDPSYRTQLATIRSSTGSAALTTATAAANYRIVGVNFEANVNGSGDVIALGSHYQTTMEQVPHHIELDRVLITGDQAVGQKRAVSVNAAHVLIESSDIRGIKAIGQDSQAIAGWNTPGPVTIRNNYLEAAGENIMFGGAHVNIVDLVPSDILIEDNLLAKDLAWRGSSWTVKNLFELKSARRVVVRGNTLEYNWSAAQPGYAVVFTPRNAGGLNPWSVVEDVEFSGNIVRHSGSAFNMLGHDDSGISGQLARIVIRDNLFDDINSTTWGGAGTFAQIGGEPRDITIDHNTVMHTGNIITFYAGSYTTASGERVTAGPILGFVFTNNMMKHNAYGIFGSGQSYGNGSIDYYTSGATVRRNVFATDVSRASRYPVDNFFPTIATFMSQFLNPAIGDYRLVSGSPYIGAGTDGGDLGKR